MTFHQTRESWLNEAVELLSELFAQTKEDGEPVKVPAVRISTGFPGGANIRKTIGQCWATKASEDGIGHIFISPVLSDPIQILGVIIHELCHAIDDNVSGHKGRFRKLATQMGLEGKMTATHASEALVELLKPLVQTLGTYPHGALNLELRPTKKQSTRMLLAACHNEIESEKGKVETCGYQVRTTVKWLMIGIPWCPRCDEQLELDDDAKAKLQEALDKAKEEGTT